MAVVSAFALSTAAEWALWTVALVHAHATVSASAAGVVSLSLMASAAVFAPVAGRVADGRRPATALAAAYTVEGLGVASAAAAVGWGLGLGWMVGGAAVAAGAVTFVRPCGSVVLPHVVRSAEELTAANVLVGYASHAAALAGPALAALLLATGDAAMALAVLAPLHGAAALAVAPLARRRWGRWAPAPSPEPRRRRTRGSRVAVGALPALRALSQRRGGLAVLVVLMAVNLQVGALDLLVVVAARDALGLGQSAPGLFSAVAGAGALAGSAAATIALTRRRLARPIVVALVAGAAGFAVLGFSGGVTLALVALVAIGLAQAFAEVLSRLMMLRVAPPEALGSVAGLAELVALAGLAAGSAIAQLLLRVDMTVAFVGVAAVLAAVTAVSVRRLGRVDDLADVPLVAVATLRSIPIFAVLPPPALETLGRSSSEVTVAAGQVLFHHGDEGDAYYVITSGTVEVLLPDGRTRSMTRGEGLGEVALVGGVARTATVRAVSDTTLLRIDRVAFLAAVTGSHEARAEALATALRYEPHLASAERASDDPAPLDTP